MDTGTQLADKVFCNWDPNPLLRMLSSHGVTIPPCDLELRNAVAVCIALPDLSQIVLGYCGSERELLVRELRWAVLDPGCEERVRRAWHMPGALPRPVDQQAFQQDISNSASGWIIIPGPKERAKAGRAKLFDFIQRAGQLQGRDVKHETSDRMLTHIAVVLRLQHLMIMMPDKLNKRKWNQMPQGVDDVDRARKTHMQPAEESLLCGALFGIIHTLAIWNAEAAFKWVWFLFPGVSQQLTRNKDHAIDCAHCAMLRQSCLIRLTPELSQLRRKLNPGLGSA
jgi:hypothetical protein